MEGSGGARWLSDDEQHVWRKYLAASRKLNTVLDRQMQDEGGVPQAYYIILAMLSEAGGHTLRMSELAELANSSPSRLSHALDRLVERGWVRRVPDPTDGRGSNAVLTSAGLAEVRRLAPGHAEAVRTHLFDLITTDQLMVLGEILEAVLDHGAAGPRTRPWTVSQ